MIFLLRFRSFSTNQTDLRNYKRQRHYGFGYWGDEIGLIFLSKNLRHYADFFSDTPVSPSLLVEHASSRVLILLHAIYKRKKATFQVVFCVWSSIISKFLAENLEYYTDFKRRIRRFQKLYYGSGDSSKSIINKQYSLSFCHARSFRISSNLFSVCTIKVCTIVKIYIIFHITKKVTLR